MTFAQAYSELEDKFKAMVDKDKRSHGGEKMYHVGNSIVGFGRLKTVPPGVEHGAEFSPWNCDGCFTWTYIFGCANGPAWWRE